MTVEQTQVIDVIGTDRLTGKVYLTISDHLPWDLENAHLLVLQEKLDSYLAFVGGGEVYTSYPDAKGRDFVIKIVLKYRPSGEGVRFLECAKQRVEDSAIEFRFGPLESDYYDEQS